MLLKVMSLLALLLLSAKMPAFSEEKTNDTLKANYIYTDASAQNPVEPVNYLMLGKGKNISSVERPGKTIEPPSSCIVSGKSFVNCRR